MVEAPPERDERPVALRVPKLPVPVVVMLSAPVSIAPKPLVMEPEFRAPTEVREEAKMEEPRALAVRAA